MGEIICEKIFYFISEEIFYVIGVNVDCMVKESEDRVYIEVIIYVERDL